MNKTIKMIGFAMIAILVFGILAAQAFDQNANPMHDSSVDGILDNVGVKMPAPTFANSASWFYYDGVTEDEAKLGELQFMIGTTLYSYRIQPSVEFNDISGLYYDWTETEDVKVGNLTAKLSYTKNGQAKIEWYDVVPGVMYSLAVAENANNTYILDIANRIFEPLQGEVDGQTGN